MVYIERNNQKFGPYDIATLSTYVNGGQILLCDVAYDTSNPQTATTVRAILKHNKVKTKIPHAGGFFTQLGKIGSELIVPRKTIISKQWLSDKRLLVLGAIGLFPSLLMLLPISGFVLFYLIALYFSTIWGIFFYYFFKTPQVTLKQTIAVFFLTQAFVFLAWDVFGIVRINPFYNLLPAGFPLNLFGYILGVGLMEELAKLTPPLIIASRAKQPLIPQTLVFYGLMSGIAFGVFEGVQYQMGINAEQEYSASFYLNILRLTSLPFLHAIWCGIAAYFISFAKLYPKYRLSLYALALFIPAILHGIYDTFCGSIWGMIIALPAMICSIILLMTYLKQGINYQSKLRQ